MKLTIAIVTFNYGRFLEQAIESCLCQRKVDFEYEVLVIDDGSIDNTQDVVRKYIDNPRFRYSPSANGGFGASLGRAIRESKGEWVMLLDADDWFADDKLSVIAGYLSKDVHYVSDSNIFVDSTGKPSGHKGCPGNTSTLTLRRSSCLDILPVDDESAFYILEIAGLGCVVSEYLTYYRIHSASLSADPAAEYARRLKRYENVQQKICDWKQARPIWLSEDARRKAEKRFRSMTNFAKVETAIRGGYRFAAAANAGSRIFTEGINREVARTLARAILLRPIPTREVIFLNHA